MENQIKKIVAEMHPTVRLEAYRLCIARMGAGCTDAIVRACDGLMAPHAPAGAAHVGLGTVDAWMTAIYHSLTPAEQAADLSDVTAALDRAVS